MTWKGNFIFSLSEFRPAINWRNPIAILQSCIKIFHVLRPPEYVKWNEFHNSLQS